MFLNPMAISRLETPCRCLFTPHVPPVTKFWFCHLPGSPLFGCLLLLQSFCSSSYLSPRLLQWLCNRSPASPSRLSLTYSSQSQNGNMIIKARVTQVPSSHKPLPGPLLRKAREAPLSSALSPASRPTSLHRDTIALLSPTQRAARDAMLMRAASCARGFIPGHRLHLGVLPCRGQPWGSTSP